MVDERDEDEAEDEEEEDNEDEDKEEEEEEDDEEEDDESLSEESEEQLVPVECGFASRQYLGVLWLTVPTVEVEPVTALSLFLSLDLLCCCGDDCGDDVTD